MNLPEVIVSPVNTPPVLNSEMLYGKVIWYLFLKLIGENEYCCFETSHGWRRFWNIWYNKREECPICLMWLGSTNSELMKELAAKGERPFPLHSPSLNPDYEKTIETGIKVMVANVIRINEKVSLSCNKSPFFSLKHGLIILPIVVLCLF